jgi:hypothetical protein
MICGGRAASPILASGGQIEDRGFGPADGGLLPGPSTLMGLMLGSAPGLLRKPSVFILEDERKPEQPYPEKQADHSPQRMTFDSSEIQADQYEDQTEDRYE